MFNAYALLCLPFGLRTMIAAMTQYASTNREENLKAGITHLTIPKHIKVNANFHGRWSPWLCTGVSIFYLIYLGFSIAQGATPDLSVVLTWRMATGMEEQSIK